MLNPPKDALQARRWPEGVHCSLGPDTNLTYGASRGLSLSIGLILRFRRDPSPWRLDYTDHGLPAGTNVYVADREPRALPPQ
jgi:hypothetical protein